MVMVSVMVFQVDKDTTKLAYMRAAMTSLAYVHGTTFSFMKVRLGEAKHSH